MLLTHARAFFAGGFTKRKKNHEALERISFPFRLMIRQTQRREREREGLDLHNHHENEKEPTGTESNR